MFKLKIEYDGKPDYELEDELITVLDKSGYNQVASGFNFKTAIRDLEFEAPNKFVKRSE